MWRKFDGSTAPFLCPPEYYEKYYKPLIKENTKNWVTDDIINELIFEFVNGEFDFHDEFLQTIDYKYLQYSLRQRYLLKTAKIKISDNDDNDDEDMIDTNTVDLELMKQLLEDGFDLNEDMKSIWFYNSKSVKSYGFYSKTFEICGKTRLKSYYNRKFKPIYTKIKLKIEGSDNDNDNDDDNDNDPEQDIGNSNDVYSLSFTFSDSLQLFWIDGLDDWDCWKEQDIKPFITR